MSAREHGRISGPRRELAPDDPLFPAALRSIPSPPGRLYVIGDPEALQEGLAVVGARKATPYGVGCAKRFAGMAAERGVTIVSGGARGCDAAAHRAALEKGAKTVAFLGGGCDEPYPAENAGLFQRIVDGGGAVVSEQEWGMPPLPYMFRARNRLIAGLSKATLIVEAGLPSGTFSTADEALAAGKEVLAVPGSITSKQSRGANRLIYQGATPVADDDAFYDQLFAIFGLMRQEGASAQDEGEASGSALERRLLEALDAEQLTVDRMLGIVSGGRCGGDPFKWLMAWLSRMQKAGRVAKYPSGRYGTVMR